MSRVIRPEASPVDRGRIDGWPTDRADFGSSGRTLRAIMIRDHGLRDEVPRVGREPIVDGARRPRATGLPGPARPRARAYGVEILRVRPGREGRRVGT
jgi:hypothetical protein